MTAVSQLATLLLTGDASTLLALRFATPEDKRAEWNALVAGIAVELGKRGASRVVVAMVETCGMGGGR